MRFALNPAWVNSGLRQKKLKGPFCIFEKFSKKLYPVYVISAFRYIRFALNPAWVGLLSKRTP